MPDESIVGEDAAQVRMTVEDDAEQVEGLALEPVGAGMDARQGIQRRLRIVRAECAQRQPLVVGDREQLVDGCKAWPGVRLAFAATDHRAAETTAGGRGGAPLVAAVLAVVHAGDIDEQLEAELVTQ